MCTSVCVFECMCAYPINYFPSLAEINSRVSGGNVQARRGGQSLLLYFQKMSEYFLQNHSGQ